MGFLRCLWLFSNSFGILMMFSIDFENDLVLLHSRAIQVFHFIDVYHSKHYNRVHTAERVIHTRLK